MLRPRLIALLLALGTLLVFFPATSFTFVNYDDTDYITENPMVNQGLSWAGIGWAFTTFHASNWHPLTWLSHMVDCQLFAGNAGGHHFVNILIHSVNVALLFLWLFRVTGKAGPAAFVAALFAWHPLHVESVAWISERKDVLSTFFALLTLLAYSRYVQSKDCKTGALAVVCFALGLLAKPMLVTLPFVLLLLDFWPFQRLAGSGNPMGAKGGSTTGNGASLGPQLREKLPFFLLTAVSCVVTYIAQKQGEAVVSFARLPLDLRLQNAVVAVAGYGHKIFWPSGLCALYPIPERIPAGTFLWSLVILIAVTVIAWRWRRQRPYCLMGWLWFLGTLVPVIGLIQVGAQSMADRYTYIPSIGLFIALVFLADELVTRIQLPRLITGGVALLISVGCIMVTENQLQFWRDSETLFRRAVAVTRNNDVALINLGAALDVQGRFDEALVYYRQAEAISGEHYQLHVNLGNVLDRLGQPEESLAEYREAVRGRPNDATMHNNLATELTVLGRYDEALRECDEAARLDPHYAWPHIQRARIFFKTGNDTKALAELNAAILADPENYQVLASVAHFLAANENSADRNGSLAAAMAEKANALSGNRQPMVLDILGMALAETGDYTNAQLFAQGALGLANAGQLKSAEAISNRLELYKQHQPWRESFRETNNTVGH